MSRRFKRLLSILVLAALAFSQGSLALAACVMERGELPQMLTGQTEHDCCDEGGSLPDNNSLPMSANGCVSHCTADLQALDLPVVIVRAPTLVPLFVLSSHGPRQLVAADANESPPAAVPPRILLHAFLI
jgi:hypothetical protein